MASRIENLQSPCMCCSDPPHKVKGRKKPLPNTMFQGVLLRPNTEIEWWHVRQTTHCPAHWFPIVSGSSKPGSPSNLPFSYHSNPFLRKVIVKRRRFLTKLVVGLEYPPPVRAVWLKMIKYKILKCCRNNQTNTLSFFNKKPFFSVEAQFFLAKPHF